MRCLRLLTCDTMCMRCLLRNDCGRQLHAKMQKKMRDCESHLLSSKSLRMHVLALRRTRKESAANTPLIPLCGTGRAHDPPPVALLT